MLQNTNKHKSNTTFIRSNLFKLYGKSVAIMLAITTISIIVAFPFYIDYVPSRELADQTTYITASFSFLTSTLLVPVIFEKIKNHIAENKYKMVATDFMVLLFSPFAGAIIGAMYISGPISYALHELSNPVKSYLREDVEHASKSGRRSFNSATLKDSTVLLPRKVRLISDEAVNELSDGGWITIYGFKSKYGIEVERYTYGQYNGSAFKRSL